MKSFWGFHVEAQGVKNKQRLLDYHLRVNPPWTTVLEGDGLALEIKAASPTTNVISRHYFPDGTWYKATPKDFLDYLDRAKVPDELWNFCENESGINPAWNIELIHLNAQRVKPRKLAILSLAVGTPPNPDEWKDPKVLELLRLCDQYREWVVIALHEYFIGVVTSGLIGGAPDNAGVPLNGPKVGENLIPKAAWPKKERNLTRWHMGRFAFMVNACKTANPPINPPRVVLTEAGADDVSDIKAWAEKLEMTPPYTSIRGWRSLVNQWAKWYPGVSTDQVYADMLTYATDVIYADSVVEGGCIYCWATPDPKWIQFDVEPYEDFIAALEKAVDVPIVQTKPIPMPKPLDASNARRQTLVSIGSGRIVRAGPGVDYKPYKTLNNGAVMTVYDPIKTDGQGMRWAWIESTQVNGWLCIDGISFGAPPVVSVDPEVIEPPSSSTTLPPVTDDMPALQTYRIPLVIEVTTTSREAAEAVAEQSLAAARFNWQMFFEMQKVYPYLAFIKDVQFKVELP